MKMKSRKMRAEHETEDTRLRIRTDEKRTREKREGKKKVNKGFMEGLQTSSEV